MEKELTFYQKLNEAVRIECFDSLRPANKVPLLAFFRRIGLSHVYWEVVDPGLEEGSALTCVAVRNRPWPPWGLGAQEIRALVHGSISDAKAGLSNVFALDEDLTNIGLTSAIYKEALEELIRRNVTEVNYTVFEGSEFARRVLMSRGFAKTEDIFLTESARYDVYEADITELLERLGLADTSVSELLGYKTNEVIFEKNALFHTMMDLSTRPFWYSNSKISEILYHARGRVLEPEPSSVPPS